MQLHKNSGSARTAYENMEFFKSQGYEVHVAAMTMDRSILEGLGVIPHKMYPWFKSTGLARRRWYNYQVEKLKRKIKPDLTIGHGDILNQDILTLHNCVFLASELIHSKPLDPDSEMAIVHGEILKKRKFKTIVANSKLMKRDIVKRFKITEELVQVIYPSLDEKVFFKKDENQKMLLREKFGFPDKVVVSLVTSGNFKKCGLDIFIEAIKQIPKEIRDTADFRVIGKDKPPVEYKDYVTFDETREDIQDYFNAIDVFVLPARIEEFGRVVSEAMSTGLPVITTNKVGASELLEGEAREYIIPPKSKEALSEAIIRLVSSGELRSKVGDLNLRASLKITKNNIFKRFEAIFLKICLIPQFFCDCCFELLPFATCG